MKSWNQTSVSLLFLYTEFGTEKASRIYMHTELPKSLTVAITMPVDGLTVCLCMHRFWAPMLHRVEQTALAWRREMKGSNLRCTVFLIICMWFSKWTGCPSPLIFSILNIFFLENHSVPTKGASSPFMVVLTIKYVYSRIKGMCTATLMHSRALGANILKI